MPCPSPAGPQARIVAVGGVSCTSRAHPARRFSPVKSRRSAPSPRRSCGAPASGRRRQSCVSPGRRSSPAGRVAQDTGSSAWSSIPQISRCGMRTRNRSGSSLGSAPRSTRSPTLGTSRGVARYRACPSGHPVPTRLRGSLPQGLASARAADRTGSACRGASRNGWPTVLPRPVGGAAHGCRHWPRAGPPPPAARAERGQGARR